MNLDPTTTAIIMAGTVGAYKAIDGLIGIIKTLVIKNGKNGKNGKHEELDTVPTQSLLEQRILGMLDKFDSQKTNKEICDERHSSLTTELQGIRGRLDEGGKVMTGMAKDIAVIVTKVGKGD